MDDKVYFPTVIPDSPLPTQLDQGTFALSPTGYSATGIYKNTVTEDQLFPKPIIAQELLSQKLNTRTKKILGQFQFTQQGAIQIGNYENGVAGDIRLSPSGITARNSLGDPTFSLDGETGDATFAGDITGGSMNINNNFTIDSQGNAVANSIKIISKFSFATNFGAAQKYGSSETDIPSTSFSLQFVNPTIVLIQANILGWIELDTGGLPYFGNGIVRLRINGTDTTRAIISGGWDGTDSQAFGIKLNFPIGTSSLHYLGVVSGNTATTVKLTAACDQSDGASRFNLYHCTFTVTTLGNA